MSTTMQHPTIKTVTRVVPDSAVKKWEKQGWTTKGKTDSGDGGGKSRK